MNESRNGVFPVAQSKTGLKYLDYSCQLIDIIKRKDHKKDREDVAVNTIEREYKERMDALTPKERMARAASMHQWAREMIARQITSDEGPIGSERLKWLIALRQYGADSTIRE